MITIMGSQSQLGNPQNNWIPYVTSKDCTLGICTLYCPQWCYVVFPPPPPLGLLGDDDDSSPGPSLSPLIIAVIGVLASAFLLVTYYTVISKFCRRNTSGGGTEDPASPHPHPHPESSSQGGAAEEQPWYVPVGGLDEAVIRSIAVCKYKRGSGMMEGTCSVCLSDFQEEETVRLLPKCTHAFHVPCIDTWLKSHSNCPLCRSDVAFADDDSSPVLPRPPVHPSPPPPQAQGDDHRRGSRRITVAAAPESQTTTSTSTDNNNSNNNTERLRPSNTPTPPLLDIVIELNNAGAGGLLQQQQPIRRSFSSGHPCLPLAATTVADVLKECEDQDRDQDKETRESAGGSVMAKDNQVDEEWMKNSVVDRMGHSSKRIEHRPMPMPMKRSLSSDGLSNDVATWKSSKALQLLSHYN